MTVLTSPPSLVVPHVDGEMNARSPKTPARTGRYVRRAVGIPGAAFAVLTTDALNSQRRSRLRIVAGIASVTMGALVLVELIQRGQRYAREPAQLFTLAPYYGIIVIVAGWTALVARLLRPGPRISAKRLRRFEIALFGPIALVTAIAFTALLADAQASLPEHTGSFALAYSLPWAGIIVSYAVLVPNSWRRCSAALAMMLLLACVPDVLVLATHGTARPVAAGYIVQKLLWLAAFGAIATFGAHRIDVLEQDAHAARMLGQYELKDLLGAGGMGEVYLAEHQFLRRPCAIKLIPASASVDATTIARFEREVQATARLTHPNAVHVYDYGRADDGTFFYAMEYLPGPTLDSLVARAGPLPAPRARHILVQICGALHEAHSLGLIHRDMKPANVIICERGGVADVAKVLDFGLVLPIAGKAETKLTNDGRLLGTPGFMAPEQISGDDATPASDVYSVGAVAFYMLTGRLLFGNRPVLQVVAAHLYERPPALATFGVAQSLSDVVDRCLAKNPVDRYADAASLENALAACEL